MPGIMTVEGYPDVLDLRMEEIKLGIFEQVPDLIDVFYTRKTPVQRTNRGSTLVPMNAAWVAFGGSLTNAYDSPEQGYSWQCDNLEFVKAIQIERQLLVFDRFDVINAKMSGLVDTGLKFRQTQRADVFNSAFAVSTAFNYSNDEALSLCNDSHTSTNTEISTATGFDNAGVSALSPVSLRAAYATMKKFRDLGGNFIGNNQATAIVVPVENTLRAEEIIKTLKGLDMANHNYNVLYDRWQVIEDIFITSTRNWFLVNLPMFKANNYWYEAVAPEFARIEEFETIVAKYRGYMLHGVGRTALWQSILGHNVA